MGDRIDDPELFVRLIDQHLAGVSMLEDALDRQEARYEVTNSQVDARRCLEICRELNAEIDYGRYLIARNPTT